MNNKIVSSKKTSAIFLAIVLITGTITILSSSSFMIGADAQAQPYYGIDNNYQKLYGQDDRDKSTKDISKSLSINKIKCINTNLNINGNNTADVNIGNKGQGYLGANSYGAGYYDDGYDNKQGKGFDDCVINNNNNNTNIVTVGGGNVTDQCAIDVEACFEQFLNSTNFALLTEALEDGITIQIEGNPPVTLNSFADICDTLEGLTTFDDLLTAVATITDTADLPLGSDVIQTIAECIAEVLGIPV